MSGYYKEYGDDLDCGSHDCMSLEEYKKYTYQGTIDTYEREYQAAMIPMKIVLFFLIAMPFIGGILAAISNVGR